MQSLIEIEVAASTSKEDVGCNPLKSLRNLALRVGGRVNVLCECFYDPQIVLG